MKNIRNEQHSKIKLDFSASVGQVKITQNIEKITKHTLPGFVMYSFTQYVCKIYIAHIRPFSI